MKAATIDRGIYLLTGVACSVVMLGWKLLTQSPFAFETWWGALLVWLLTTGVPLSFVFGYPRFVFGVSPDAKKLTHAAVLNSVCFAGATILFPFFVDAAQRSSTLETDSLFIPIGFFSVLLSILVIFFVTALFLMFKGTSGFAALAAVLIWPYWLLLAIIDAGRWFQPGYGDAVLYFLCTVAPLFLVFAAGVAPDRAKLPHIIALIGCLGASWIFRTVVPNQVLGNVWVMFNQQNGSRILSHVDVMYAATAILSVVLLIVTLTTAAIRLLPAAWIVRGFAVRERTWPAFLVCLIFVGGWFKISVMPYRIAGAADGDWAPTLKILHLQKRGLQFHEKCIRVTAYKDQVISVYFTEDDRKLLRYTFEQRNVSAVHPPQDLAQRIHALFPPRSATESDSIRPVSTWMADNWYVYAEGRGYEVYGTTNGRSAPAEVVALFRYLDGLPKGAQDKSKISDICLGLCFDPLSAMGSLYANHRCSSDIHGKVFCR